MKKLYLYVVASSLLALPFYTKAQVSVLGNAGSSSNYVGWNNAQAFPLQIKHEGNQPILFQTNATPRMKLNGNVSYDINGVGSAARNGYLLLGGNTNLSFLTSGRLRERVIFVTNSNFYFLISNSKNSLGCISNA